MRIYALSQIIRISIAEMPTNNWYFSVRIWKIGLTQYKYYRYPDSFIQ